MVKLTKNLYVYDCFKTWSDFDVAWVFSDPHFEDPDCKLMNSDWPSPEEQVKLINSKVGKRDLLFILGDVGNTEWIKRLKGYKVLIKGNHDSGSANYQRKVRVINNITNEEVDNLDNIIYRNQMLSYWQDKAIDAKYGQASALSDVRIEDNHLFDEVYEGPLMISEKIILSHEPIKNINWAFNIHGHDHSNIEVNDNYHLNLCAEHVNYTPVCLKHIIESGVLKNIDSIHRITIDKATENKRKKNK